MEEVNSVEKLCMTQGGCGQSVTPALARGSPSQERGGIKGVVFRILYLTVLPAITGIKANAAGELF